MRIRVLWFVAVVVLAVGVPGLNPAGADPYGGETGGYPYVADSADHWYCFYTNITGSDQDRYKDAMAYLDTATDMYDVLTSMCGSSTDIMYLENPNLGAGVAGIAVCVRLVVGSTTMCDAYWVATNLAIIPDFVGPGDAPVAVHETKTIRHETGHTTGLTHNTTTYSAMRSGVLPDLGIYNFVWALHETHHIDHINTQF